MGFVHDLRYALHGLFQRPGAQRRREIGIRIARGAQRREVAAAVLLQGLRLAATGLVLGALAALAVGPILSSRLFEVSPTDPPTLLALVLVLVFVTLLASYLPARRAATVDPVTALRDE